MGPAMTVITCIDLETAGLDPAAHGVCEVGWCSLEQIGDRWHITGAGNHLFNPGCPIDAGASAKHHLIDADLKGCAPWSTFHLFMLGPPRPAVLAAHNAKFDRQWLTDEITGGLPWVCTYKASLRLWPNAPGHDNQVLRYWLNPPGLRRDLATPAHRAFPDAYVTAHLLREMLDVAPLESLIRWASVPALLPRCMIGRHRGKAWAGVPPDFLEWMLTKDFDEDTLFTVRQELRLRASS